MLKKMLVLGAVTAAFCTVALAPLAQSDTFYKCPKGATFLKYCQAVKLCVVPHLRRDTTAQARATLLAHDCRLGRVLRTRRHTRGFPRNRVISQNPPPNTVREQGNRVAITLNR